MFDIVNVDLSRFQKLRRRIVWFEEQIHRGLHEGTVAALLAGACVAPVVISVVAGDDVACQRNHGRFVAPILLGLGMDYPAPSPGGLFLPKPGKWMMRVKYGFGVMIILFAAYYGHLAYGLFQSSSGLVAQAVAGETQVPPTPSSLTIW